MNIEIKIDGVEYEGILRPKKNTSEKIIGKICSAYYCESNQEGKKWQVEYKKQVSMILFNKRTKIIKRVSSYDEALALVNETDNKVYSQTA